MGPSGDGIDLMMKIKAQLCAGALVLTFAAPAAMAQIAGVQPLGGTAEETNGLLHGWSVRKALVDQPVYNNANDKVGSVYDVIIAPDRKATYVVLSVGGFLGMGIHYVAIPVDHFEIRNGNLYLGAATKEALKDVPEFQYNKLEKATKPRKIE
jgi:PRC-barrel domain